MKRLNWELITIDDDGNEIGTAIKEGSFEVADLRVDNVVDAMKAAGTLLVTDMIPLTFFDSALDLKYMQALAAMMLVQAERELADAENALEMEIADYYTENEKTDWKWLGTNETERAMNTKRLFANASAFVHERKQKVRTAKARLDLVQKRCQWWQWQHPNGER